MTDDMKLTIEKFNGTNFAYWKMQIKDLLYQKNFYLPLGGKAKKPATMSDAEWEVLDRKAFGAIQLSQSLLHSIYQRRKPLKMLWMPYLVCMKNLPPQIKFS